MLLPPNTAVPHTALVRVLSRVSLKGACFSLGHWGRVLHRYDKDGSGQLDVIEFDKVCSDFGFGTIASTLFRALDEDSSGLLSYKGARATRERALGARGLPLFNAL